MTAHNHPNINNAASPTLTSLPPCPFSHHHIDAMQQRADPTPGDPWLDNEWLNNKWWTTLQNEQLNDEGEDGDDAQHCHGPGSVPAQVSQHKPSHSILWQGMPHCHQRHGNHTTNGQTNDQVMNDQPTNDPTLHNEQPRTLNDAEQSNNRTMKQPTTEWWRGWWWRCTTLSLSRVCARLGKPAQAFPLPILIWKQVPHRC